MESQGYVYIPQRWVACCLALGTDSYIGKVILAL